MLPPICLRAAGSAPPLRVGVIVDDAAVPAYVAAILDQLDASGFAHLAGMIVRGKRVARRGGLYERWDRRRIDPATDPLARVDCTRRIVESTDARLDVVLDFCSEPAPAPETRCGVWRLRFFEQKDTQTVAIERTGTEETIARAVVEKLSRISDALNRPQAYWGAACLVIGTLRKLHAGAELLADPLSPPSRPPRHLLSELASSVLRRLRGAEKVAHWRVAVRTGSRCIPDTPGTPDLSGFSLIESPPDRFFADPFLFERDGRTWLFFEDYEYETRLGRLSCALIEDGVPGKPVRLLERPYHLSYPHIFEDHGELYMIPETGGNRTIELYRCTRFPDRWALERELFRGWAVDTTLWIEDGIYWFFTTLREERGRATQLWLFSAPSLTGEWTAHPANPISADVRNNRGAGAIFRRNGRLFRPSQDGSGSYGRSFTLNEVVALTGSEYREEPRVTVDPGWAEGLVGTHTYAQAPGIEVIDGCVLEKYRK